MIAAHDDFIQHLAQKQIPHEIRIPTDHHVCNINVCIISAIYDFATLLTIFMYTHYTTLLESQHNKSKMRIFIVNLISNVDLIFVMCKIRKCGRFCRTLFCGNIFYYLM